MTSTDFEKSNQAFLQAALRWLRDVLEAGAALASGKGALWAARPARKAAAASRSAQALRAELERAAAAEPEPAFVVLARRFGMSPFERDMLMLAAAMEIDTGVPALVSAAQGDPNKRYPTFALGMSLFEQPSWDALSPEHPLRAQRLLEVHQSGAVSLLAAPLRIDERIAAYIKGLNDLDERLAALATMLAPMDSLPPSQEGAALALSRWFALPESRGCVQLGGSHASAKIDVVARAAALAGQHACAIPVDALPAAMDELDTFVRLWSREAQLLPLVLLIQGVEGVEPLSGEDGKPAVRPRWVHALSKLRLPCLIDVRQTSPDIESVAALSIEPPNDSERRSLWTSALGEGDVAPADSAVARLAGEFKTSASQLGEAALRVRSVVGSEEAEPDRKADLALTHAWSVCAQRAGAALAGITRCIEPRATIDSVKLPPTETAQLDRLISHARYRYVVTSDFGFGQRGSRGLGLAALFHGESGTGKTLAAEAVANALSLSLAVVDLATVKSKYIGETEKNLRRVFDAAEQGGAVLFFDEADALFGKRSDVKDSHDRYANVEINYLLSRMESFSGVAILATNMKHALDPAFMRRLRFVVGFPFPGVAERKSIWQSVFPSETPLGELDFDRLARFSLTGGSIFNAALAAAHTAAAAGSIVEMPHILDAVRWELRKLERPVAEAEFRWLPREGQAVEAVA